MLTNSVRPIMIASLRRSPYAVTGSKLPTAVGTTPAPQIIIGLTRSNEKDTLSSV
ncbi:MAG: hypothetical protein GX262_03610 [Clostridia bacterium]|nr:hypothetical protein [Clostridia bacterium]